MAALLALLSAVFFALAATLQQRGEFQLARRGRPAKGGGGLVRRLALALLPRHATHAGALDRGKLVVVQPRIAGAGNRETPVPGAEGAAAAGGVA
ncbi:MAG TPA: hypothetical protein VMT10_08930 [Solirubrobacteraceae bacterium]|nr:hypothetical protein [Solirubrobacteraceae bacterium]